MRSTECLLDVQVTHWWVNGAHIRNLFNSKVWEHCASFPINNSQCFGKLSGK